MQKCNREIPIYCGHNAVGLAATPLYNTYLPFLYLFSAGTLEVERRLCVGECPPPGEMSEAAGPVKGLRPVVVEPCGPTVYLPRVYFPCDFT